MKLNEYPDDYRGPKRYVYVDGHGAVAACYTYNTGGKSQLLPEYGGKPFKDNRTGCNLYVMRDIGEYKSIVDGEMITSRSQHREHIRKHDLVEIGNEKIRPMHREQSDLGSIGRDIKRAMNGELRGRA